MARMLTSNERQGRTTVSTSGEIRHHTDGPIARITIDRAAKHNAMTYAMRDDLRSLVRAYDRDPAVAVIVLTADGPSFCAGRDIREQVETNRPAFDGSDDDLTQFGLPPTRKILVTAARGNALGLGAYLFLAGDIRVASDNLRLAFPEVPTGVLAPYWLEATEHLPRAVAFRLAVLGDTAGARELQVLGMITETVADDDLEAVTQHWVERVLLLPPEHARTSKDLMDRHRFTLTAAVRAREGDERRRLDALDDTREAAAAFVEQRRPRFSGTTATPVETARPQGGAR